MRHVGIIIACLLLPTVSLQAAPAPERYCHAGPGHPAERARVCIATRTYKRDICRALETAAVAQALPVDFFARLIWQESRFAHDAVSPKGAQGIAQFIPSTARLRGLEDAFNPAEALTKSAHYLSELQRRFGNLGLAAAAYNAGEERVRQFLAGNPFMPFETRSYVAAITGHGVEDWKDGETREVDFSLVPGRPFAEGCVILASRGTVRPFQAPSPDWKPWGVQVAAHFSPAVARKLFARVRARFPSELGQEQALVVRRRNRSFGTRSRYTVRVGRDSRAEATALCRRLRSAGGVCTVVKN